MDAPLGEELRVLHSVRRRLPGFPETSSSGIKQQDSQARALLSAWVVGAGFRF